MQVFTTLYLGGGGSGGGGGGLGGGGLGGGGGGLGGGGLGGGGGLIQRNPRLSESDFYMHRAQSSWGCRGNISVH